MNKLLKFVKDFKIIVEINCVRSVRANFWKSQLKI